MPDGIIECGKQWVMVHSLVQLERYCHTELNAQPQWFWRRPPSHVCVYVYGRDAASPMFQVRMAPDYGGRLNVETTLLWWCKLVRKDYSSAWELHSGRRRIHRLGEIADYMPQITTAYRRMLDDRSCSPAT